MLGSPTAIHPSRSTADAVFRLVDAAAIFVALQLAVHWTAPLSAELFWLIGAMATMLLNVVGGFCGMYRNWRGTDIDREIRCTVISWFFAFVALVAFGYTTSLPDQIDRLTTASWFVLGAVTMSVNRLVIRQTLRLLRSQGVNARRYAVVGVNELAFQLVSHVEACPGMGLLLHGFYDDRPASRTPALPDGVGHHIGNLDDLVAAARDRRVDHIYITFPMRAEQRIRDVLQRLADTTATVYIVPDFFVFELLHSRWTNIGGLPAVSIFEQPFYGVDGAVKRLMDLFLAGAALLVLVVPMTLIALAIKLTSSGPVFFRQRRYGLDGREIHVWKFRSMTVCEDGNAVAQARKEDPRVTPVGAFLRSTSLDEIPQLFNVVGGSMSLVGPRPHATAHNEHYRTMIQGYMLRHKVRPGITGLAQVNGCRGETDTLEKMERRIEYDHRYIREWSIWVDIKILLRTVVVVLSQEHAY